MMNSLALALVLILSVSAANADSLLKGPVTHVRDVDTIEVRNVPIRLNGLDGPELGTRTEDAGKKWMQKLVLRKPVLCRLSGATTGDRYARTCYPSSGEDIAAMAVAAGLARDCPRYSKGRYRQVETDKSRSLPRSSYCRK